VRRHHGRFLLVAPVPEHHHDGRSHNGHDTAAQTGDHDDPPTTAGDHPTAGAERSPFVPDFCIPPPPDLDCGDVNGSDFTVLPPDPHRFDREGDGVGCES
jgi:hypothetical protein